MAVRGPLGVTAEERAIIRRWRGDHGRRSDEAGALAELSSRRAARVWWAGYRVYRDYQQAGRWEERNVIPVAITLCTALLIVGGMFWYANRPEGDRRP